MKTLRSILFEYFKRGFLNSSRVWNGETTIKTQNEADKFQKWIINDFLSQYEQHKSNIEDIQFHLKNSDIKQNSKDNIILDTSKILSKDEINDSNGKILTNCPICGIKIRISDLGIENLQKHKITNYPFCYIHLHKTKDIDIHALIMYLDANYNVRGKKATSFVKF